MMQVALISPIRMELWSRQGDLLFITPDNALPGFYRKEQRYKMLDNGVYERGRPFDNELFIKLADEMAVDEIVLPDYIQDWGMTYRAVNEFIETHKKRWKYAVVPQGKDPVEWMECYVQLRDNPEVDVLCVPIWLQKKFGCRSAVIHKLIRTGEWSRTKLHHLIGLDGYGELYNYDACNIRSVDTSLPFSRTAAGLPLTFEDSKVSRVNLKGTQIEIYKDALLLLQENISKLMGVAHSID